MTALMFAVKVGSFDVVKLLVENSANLFAQNSVSLPPSLIIPYNRAVAHMGLVFHVFHCVPNTLLI